MVEAFDKAEMKESIIELFQAEKPEIPLLVGNGMAGWGESNAMRVEQFGNLYVCGDGESESNIDLSPMAPRVGICAAMQANVVMSVLLEKSFGAKDL
jgi:sulfur carrier protein ThiS adenylyltransferase